MYKMEKRHRIIVGIIVIIVGITTIGLIAFPQALVSPTPIPQNSNDVAPRNDLADPNSINPSPTQDDLSDVIVVSSPKMGQNISSPVTITGKARGNFFFEASFPIELVNLNTGLDIAKGIATAQGEWMTDDFVPFTATLTFDSPPAATPGKLILRKDNPSGLPENDQSIEILVTVK